MLHRTRPQQLAGITMGAPPPNSEEELDRMLSEPTPELVESLRRGAGDVVVLGAGGKMGPTLALMLRRGLDAARRSDRVIAVSRFSSSEAENRLRAANVETIRCDLGDRIAVSALPDAPNVIFMAGQKFGTSDSPGATWMMNTVVPALVAERYAGARIVAFSTGNVYPLVPVQQGGAREEDAPDPVGEYASSCLGRERILEYYSARHDTPVSIVRLNYAVELRYGVLVDIALRVWRGEPVDVRMGYVNVIWQRDANARAIQCLEHAAAPPFIINITGRETLAVRALAQHFGQLLGRTPVIVGDEEPDALLSDASRSVELFGPPTVTPGQMMIWIADWIQRGRPLLDRPTHFEERQGRF